MLLCLLVAAVAALRACDEWPTVQGAPWEDEP